MHGPHYAFENFHVGLVHGYMSHVMHINDAYFIKTFIFYICFISLCMNQSLFMHGKCFIHITCKKVASTHKHA